ncbi:hemicentin-2 [Gasterosteus aculeatus]
MEAVIGLFVMIHGASHGVKTHCDGRQNRAQCFGALGGTLVLQLMDKASEIQTYQWIKNGTTILNMKNNAIVYNMLKDRSFFTPSNGTLRINNLIRTDGGEYKLDPVGSDGKSSGSRVQQLTIQAPVSSVLLVHECLSHGERKVSCSSEGADSPQYSWTLDGDTLTDSQLLGGNNETNIITLKQHVSGRLVCSVRNDVSSHSKEETVSTCGVETHCDGRQNGAQCFGDLGGTLVLQLMDKASEIHKYQWSKNGTIILEGNNNKTSFNRIENRSLFTPSDGIFRINNLIKTDGGEYKLETFGSDGKSSGSRFQQLTIQAPVSSVLLIHECLSHGERKVSCSSGGADSPQYSWTLDGDTLTDSQLLGGNNETNIITLKQHVSGRLVCSVRNDVSSHSKEETVSTCGFIFINCTSADGTHISQWVFAANNYLCIETTASPTNTPTLPDGKESGITESTVRNDVSSHSKEETVSTCGVETHCDGRQNGAQCFGDLGGTLVLQLMDKASEIHKYQWSKNGTIILEGNNNKTSFNRIENRSLFTPSDGIFRINNLIKTDGGEYKLETFGSDGKSSGSRVQQLTIQGVVTHCDGRQNGAQCFGALGGTLVLQLMDKDSEIQTYQWIKDGTTILNMKYNAIVYNMLKDRSFFTPNNGTLTIKYLIRTDGGEYKLDTSGSYGKSSGSRVQQLTIQAPVSSVLLVHECLSHGERKVSCSSGGADSPQYSWTLDGDTLTDSQLLGGNNETNIITLKQHVSGRLVCSVRNDVSSHSKEETVSTCGFIFINCTSPNGTHISQWVFAANNTLCIETTASPTNTPTLPDVGSLTTAVCVPAALVLLLVVGVSVVCAQKKKRPNKPKEEDDQELTYSEVRIGPRPGRQMKQRAEEEVEYGEVKFSQRPRHNVEPAADECVYAKVRRER